MYRHGSRISEGRRAGGGGADNVKYLTRFPTQIVFSISLVFASVN